MERYLSCMCALHALLKIAPATQTVTRGHQTQRTSTTRVLSPTEETKEKDPVCIYAKLER